MCAKITELIATFDSNEKFECKFIDRYIAELKAIRTQYMYAIYHFFGAVNVKLDPTTLTDETPMARLTDKAYCDALLSDINDALNSTLEDRHAGGSDFLSSNLFTVLRRSNYHLPKQ